MQTVPTRFMQARFRRVGNALWAGKESYASKEQAREIANAFADELGIDAGEMATYQEIDGRWRVFCRQDPPMGSCAHPSGRMFSWHAWDGTLCITCCDCGKPLVGGVE